jgi:hypothetical protein
VSTQSKYGQSKCHVDELYRRAVDAGAARRTHPRHEAVDERQHPDYVGGDKVGRLANEQEAFAVVGELTYDAETDTLTLPTGRGPLSVQHPSEGWRE